LEHSQKNRKKFKNLKKKNPALASFLAKWAGTSRKGDKKNFVPRTVFA